ncbi:Neurexophilin [Mactra antiquata]
MQKKAENIESPAMPNTPENNESPTLPETDVIIEKPNMQEIAVNIESPAMPETAENIDIPDMPETAENNESPAVSKITENIENPTISDQAVKSENLSLPIKAENIGSSNMPEKTEHINSSAMSDQAAKSENPSLPVKAEHMESHISPEKAEHNELPPEKDKSNENATTYKMIKSEEKAKSKSPGASIWKEKFTGYMTEEESLIYKQCENVNELTSPNTTKLIIRDNNRNYKLNDRIQLTITAHDHYGKPKTEGGDMFLATIKSEFEKASAPGVVTDLHNGSYNVEFDALWTGKAHVPAAYMIAGYNKGNISDIGYCHVNRSMLIYNDICKGDNPVGPHVCKDVGLTPERVEICNFTSINSGIPWYCLKPLNKGLGCEDWKYISRHNDTQLPGMTKCEQAAYFKIFLELSTNIDVNIEPQFDGDDRKIVDLPSNPCSKYNTTALWLRREPTGFYYNGIWHLRHCKGVRVDNIYSCMKNKNFYIIGDSTMRQWYFNLMFRYGCNQTTEEWTEPKWYKKSVCRNEEHNYTLTFSAHNLPVSVPHTLERLIFSTSVSRYIDRIADDENAILVFHLFGHMIPYHPEFYKLQLTTIRNSAEKLFSRNKRARIMIKSPHIFPEEKVIMAYQYDRISYEVFYDLFDRVYYLNNMDSSTAEMPTNIHPDPIIVDAMLDQVLVYSCD